VENNQNDVLASYEQMELAVHFITGYRGAGHQLPYTELAIVKRWLGAAKNLDHLLIVLADVLPEHFQPSERSRPKSLHYIRNHVIDKLRSTR
jgi:hypothetical protein